jgi:hypothetical protein
MGETNQYPIRGSFIADLIIGEALFQAHQFIEWNYINC